MKSSPLSIGLGLLVISGCAPVEPTEVAGAATNALCFTSSEVDNFRIENQQEAYIHTRRSGVYRLDAAPNCFEQSATAVVVEPYVDAGGRICPGEQARVRVLTSSIPKTCIARVAGPITDSAVSGLPG